MLWDILDFPHEAFDKILFKHLGLNFNGERRDDESDKLRIMGCVCIFWNMFAFSLNLFEKDVCGSKIQDFSE